MLPKVVALYLVLSGMAIAQSRVPTVDELLNIETVGSAQISPDGRWVAYVLNKTDFTTDTHPTEVWLLDVSTGERVQMTRSPKSASSPRWSPNSRWLGFLSDRLEDRNQVFVIRPTGGEAQQLTKSETAVQDFAWSPDGKMLLFAAPEKAQPTKERDDRYGKYEVVRRDYNHVQLRTVDVATALRDPQAGQALTSGKDFSVSNFSWAPDQTRVAFSATRNPDLTQGSTSDIYTVQLSDRRVQKIVALTGSDTNPRYSPDGQFIVFTSAMGNVRNFASNSRLAVVDAAGTTPPRSITNGFDENPSFVDWKADGIYFSGLQKTAGHLFRTDLQGTRVERISKPDALMGSSFSFASDGKTVAFVANSPTSLGEVFVATLSEWSARKLTDISAQVRDFKLGTREVVSWKSQDGATIEGILIKPADFDPARKYPLMTIIHGGPTGIDRPGLLQGDTRYYPSDIWANRGALVLKVNYRGSAGYGEAFRRLNIRNLGVGDAWDVLSGVDHLVAKGWVDPKKVACMGWSQGGYISAFLTASSDRFAAISVGAGISDWATYYYNTDITQFTINYLGDDPVDDPEIYRKTSPVSYIKKAKTPTLIQHGELDKRVPIANGYQLRQALEDRGVPAEMVVYKGFGHGINKPKSMRAVMEHNLSWFNHHIFGDAAPDFTSPNGLKKPTNQ